MFRGTRRQVAVFGDRLSRKDDGCVMTRSRTGFRRRFGGFPAQELTGFDRFGAGFGTLRAIVTATPTATTATTATPTARSITALGFFRLGRCGFLSFRVFSRTFDAKLFDRGNEFRLLICRYCCRGQFVCGLVLPVQPDGCAEEQEFRQTPPNLLRPVNSRKSETYRKASRSSPISTNADCIPGKHAGDTAFVDRSCEGVFVFPLIKYFSKLIIFHQRHFGFVGGGRHIQFFVHGRSGRTGVLAQKADEEGNQRCDRVENTPGAVARMGLAA